MAKSCPDTQSLRFSRFRLLRSGGERRKSETESENEPDPPHGHLAGGWLAESLADECCPEELAAWVEHPGPLLRRVRWYDHPIRGSRQRPGLLGGAP
jgi:hypothetical protein